jgi:hypothetical protein
VLFPDRKRDNNNNYYNYNYLNNKNYLDKQASKQPTNTYFSIYLTFNARTEKNSYGTVLILNQQKMSKQFLFAATMVALASAAGEESLVKDAIVATLKEAININADSEAQGVENCVNKCKNTFDNTQYAIQTQTKSTYEYFACEAGCKICDAQQRNGDNDAGACFKTCKDTDWLTQMKDDQGNPVTVVKGVIEPDKACEMGCVIQTCQVVCTGGTTDMKQTSANAKDWWPSPNGCPGNKGNSCGCSIKTGGVRPGGYYAQNGKLTTSPIIKITKQLTLFTINNQQVITTIGILVSVNKQELLNVAVTLSTFAFIKVVKVLPIIKMVSLKHKNIVLMFQELVEILHLQFANGLKHLVTAVIQ